LHPSPAVASAQFKIVPVFDQVAVSAVGTVGTDVQLLPPPLALLAPAHDKRKASDPTSSVNEAPCARCKVVVHWRRFLPMIQTIKAPGHNRLAPVSIATRNPWRRPEPVRLRPVFFRSDLLTLDLFTPGLFTPGVFELDEVEMLNTTSKAELPGVTTFDGLKRHCAPAGKPEQDRVTDPLKALPTGCTARL
jgi:hypothetical protein